MTAGYYRPGTSEPRSRSSKLIGVPKIQAFESPASWLSRAALSQGATPKEFWEMLEIPDRVDPDLLFDYLEPVDVAEPCGLEASDFEFARRMFTNLTSIDETGEIFLKRSGKRPVYRYCAACLHFSRVKHFMVHWRFEAWRHCPLHQCLMDDRCLNCFAGIVLPTDMLVGGPQQEGIATLGKCMRCGHPLSSHWKAILNELNRVQLNFGTKSKLAAGRVLLSALYHRHVLFMTDGQYSRAGLNYLLAQKENGTIPDESFELSESHFGLFSMRQAWLIEGGSLFSIGAN